MGPEWHVTNDQGVVRPSCDCPAMVQDVVDRDRNRRLVAQREDAQCISDQQYRDTGLIERFCSWVVVRGQHGEWGSRALECLDVEHGDAHLGSLLTVAAP